MSTKTNVEPVDPIREERAGKVREVGSQAIWSLSSCKPGFGVDQLRDDCMDTYWQSDGQLPHLVNIQFRRKTTVHDICIFTDYKLDESYTPSWVLIPIKDIHEKPIRTFMIQIAVISNHQNGRDTHMRQIKIHSPMECRGIGIEEYGNFVTVACQQYSYIR
ncbi:Anaphase-promoting complex subunit 10 [Blattella germanica]|nr:Anaphase-promoting complex subunit 10 [Blattella germanica]